MEDCLLRELNVDEVLALSTGSRRETAVAEELEKDEGGFLDVTLPPARLNGVSPD
jgi:hypothetical protein